MQIKTKIAPDGAVLHLIPKLPSALPPVQKRDLEQAWEVAQAGGVAATGRRKFSFGAPRAAAVALVVEDQDAAAWVAALEQKIGLQTAHGVSVCLRLLALVALMGQAKWARGWFVVTRGEGAVIRSELLQAAANAPLTDSGNFDETALRALLPQAADRGLES